MLKNNSYVLEIVIFLTGAVVMILELVGSRIIAPYAGNTIIAWTSLIGVILGCLSLGYILGGKLADKDTSYQMLGNILLLSSLLIALTNFIKPFTFVLIDKVINNIKWGSVILTTILFGPVSIILGIVPIYVIKLRLKNVKTSGKTVGRLYALSTIGSIVGTFLSGFFLIAFFGSSKILIFLSILLMITSFLVFWDNYKRVRLYIVILLLGIVPLFLKDFSLSKVGDVIIDVDSNYSRIIIAKREQASTKRPILAFFTGRVYQPTGYQSAMYLDNNEDDLVASYAKFFRLANYFQPKISKALMLGGAGCVFARDFLRRNPQATIDVVEIDPKNTELAKKYFRLENDSRLNIFHEDARKYINKSTDKYDTIFIDVFNDIYIPFHLTTKEFVKKEYDVLDGDGLVFMNIISGIEGEEGKFLRAEYATYKSVFPQVYIFPVVDLLNALRIQNLVLVAAKSNIKPLVSDQNSEYSYYLSHLWNRKITNDIPVLTDDFAPVEYYFDSITK